MDSYERAKAQYKIIEKLENIVYARKRYGEAMLFESEVIGLLPDEALRKEIMPLLNGRILDMMDEESFSRRVSGILSEHPDFVQKFIEGSGPIE